MMVSTRIYCLLDTARAEWLKANSRFAGTSPQGGHEPMQ
jgi:hypothetical protein